MDSEHCLDQLRQSIQCSGDLTPVPLRPYGKSPNINLIGPPQTHTWFVYPFLIIHDILPSEPRLYDDVVGQYGLSRTED